MSEPLETNNSDNVAELKPMTANSSTSSLVMDRGNLEQMQKAAEMMASAKVTIPAHLAGSQGDCLAVIMQSMQWNMNPFAVAQKTHIVSGKLGYEAQLVNAVVSSSGAIKGRFHYEYGNEGSDLTCRVGAVLKGENAIQWGEWLALSSVKVKNSPLWTTNPKQQLGYLQVKNWARQYTPGAILGVYSTDELEAIDPREMGDLAVGPDGVAEPSVKTPQRKSSDEKPNETKGTTIDNTSGAVVDEKPHTADVSGKTTGAPNNSNGAAPSGVPTLNDNMLKIVRANLKKTGVSDEELPGAEAKLCHAFKVGTLEEIPATQINAVLEQIKAPQ